MGNCFSDVPGGRAAIGGTARGLLNAIDAPNDAVDNFLRSRGYHGLFSQIELSFSASGLRDRDFLSKVGGWTQEYDGLTFVAIWGAGHEVPLHRPKLALSLFKSCIAGTSMPTLQLVSDS